MFTAHIYLNFISVVTSNPWSLVWEGRTILNRIGNWFIISWPSIFHGMIGSKSRTSDQLGKLTEVFFPCSEVAQSYDMHRSKYHSFQRNSIWNTLLFYNWLPYCLRRTYCCLLCWHTSILIPVSLYCCLQRSVPYIEIIAFDFMFTFYDKNLCLSPS